MKKLPKEFSVKVLNKDHAEAVQKRLFDLGFEWVDSGKKVIDVINKEGFLYIVDGSRGYRMYLGHNNSLAELNLEDLYTSIKTEPKKPLSISFTEAANSLLLKDDTLQWGDQHLTRNSAISMAKRVLEYYSEES